MAQEASETVEPLVEGVAGYATGKAASIVGGVGFVKRGVSKALKTVEDVSGRLSLKVKSIWGGKKALEGLATNADEAVFWSGIRNRDAAAAKWIAQNGGSTLETTLINRGIKLPVWDQNNPAAVAAWRQASKNFAAGAKGDIRVLQADAVGIKSTWAEVEFPALKANPKVTSIKAINPDNGVETILWSK